MPEGPGLVKELDRYVFPWTKDGVRRRTGGAISLQEFDTQAGTLGHNVDGALLAAAQEANSKGGYVLVPPGDYLITGVTFQALDNLAVIGWGSKKPRFYVEASNHSAFVFTGAGGSYYFENIEVEGAADSVDDNPSHGFYSGGADTVESIEFVNCEIHGFNNGTNLNGGGSRFRWYGGRVYNCPQRSGGLGGYGISMVDFADVQVIAPNVEADRHCIYIDATALNTTLNAQILSPVLRGRTVEAAPANGFEACINVDKVKAIQVIGGEMTGGIGQITCSDCENVTIDSPICRNSLASASVAQRSAIWVFESVAGRTKRAIITAPIIDAPGANGIHTDFSGVLSIVAPQIQGAGSNGMWLRNDPLDVEVIGGSIDGSAASGIYYNGAATCRVIGTRLTNNLVGITAESLTVSFQEIEALFSGNGTDRIDNTGGDYKRIVSNGEFVAPIQSDATRGAAGVAGRVIYNTTDSNLNIDTGAAWILPDGTPT